MLRRKIRGVIFDLDGTLVDSQLNFAAMRQDLKLSSTAPILESIAAIETEAERERLLAIVHSHEMAGADRATPMPGANELLANLIRKSIKTAIFTRNSKIVTDRTLECLKVNIPLIVTREDAAPKPDPAGLHLIIAKWGLEADEVIFVGDYLYDIEAGRRANVPTLLYSPGDPDFSHDHPHVIRSLVEVEQYL